MLGSCEDEVDLGPSTESGDAVTPYREGRRVVVVSLRTRSGGIGLNWISLLPNVARSVHGLEMM